MFKKTISDIIATLRKPNLARRLFVRLSRVSNYAVLPSTITLDITHSCNLRCQMCGQQFLKGRRPSLNTKQFEHVLNAIPSLRNVNILPQGEPFSNPDLEEMLKIGGERNIVFSIVTNGTMLSDANINKLSNVQEICVSIDHPHPEGYKQIRGVDLEGVLKNLRQLRLLKPEIKLSISAVIMESNVKALPDFIKLAKHVGAYSMSFIHVLACWEDLWHKHGLNSGDLTESLVRTGEEARSSGVLLSATPLLQRPRLCSEPWRTPYVNVFGDIYPCCFIHSSGEEHLRTEFLFGKPIDIDLSQYKMGNIFNDPFARIWNAAGPRRLRQTVRSSTGGSFLARDHLMNLRAQLDPSDPYAYCRVCLFRQDLAC